MSDSVLFSRPRSIWFFVAAFPCCLALSGAVSVPEDVFPTDLVPAPTGTCDVSKPVGFGTSNVVMAECSLRLPSNPVIPPSAGTVQVQGCDFTFQCRLSLDGGVTFHQARSLASASLHVTGAPEPGSCAVEMLSLTCSLPGGVMLRESPTKQSLGQTKRSAAPTGGFRIGSFFDIFTEVSIDGGTTWTPANGVARAVQSAAAYEFASSTDVLPPAGSVLSCPVPIRFSSAMGSFVFRHTAVSGFASPVSPPAPGGSSVCVTAATLTGECSTNGGTDFSPFSAPVSVTLGITADSGPVYCDTRHFFVEVLAMSTSSGGQGTGGGLPQGMLLRESPTRISSGKTSLRTCPDGTCRISSFFDIFTELSLDFGQSWIPAADGCSSFSSAYNPREYAYSSDLLPLAAEMVSDDGCQVGFAGTGVVLAKIRKIDTCISRSPRLQPPTTGQQAFQMDGDLDFLLSQDGGATFVRHRVPVLNEVMVSSYRVAGGDEMPEESLSFSCTVPGTPVLMIRESPSKASLGACSKRIANNEYMIGTSSTVCLEMSRDGGTTWIPADAPVRLSGIPLHEQACVCKSDFLPPRNGSYGSDSPEGGVSYALTQHYLKKKLQVWLSSTSQKPPAKRGDTAVMAFSCTAGCEISSNGGQTWVPYQAPATCTMSVTNPLYQENNNAGENPLYDTEMLSLSFTLPNGMMVRESPTLPSKGRTTIRYRAPAGEDATYAIQSFFDVFTELSVDGGTTWAAGNDFDHLVLSKSPDPVFVRSDWAPFPARVRACDTEYPARVSSTHSLRALSMDCDSPDFLVSGPRVPLPAPGSPSVTRVCTCPMSFKYSTDGGATHTAVQTTGTFSVCYSVNPGVTWGDSSTIVEVLSCDISGTSLPPGAPMVRESPTKASLGRTSCRTAPGGYRVDSFFDIFLELSFDGGATWLPASDALRMGSVETAPSVVFADDLVPSPGCFTSHGGALSLRCPIRESPTLARRVRYSESSSPSVVARTAPPTSGQFSTVIDSRVLELEMSSDDGASYQVFRAPLFLRYDMRNVAGSSGQTSFDTEMLQFECSGGTLPAGCMLRESPTLPSKGKTSIRSRSLGGVAISSFFDVFLELSLDNGRTWDPFDLPLHMELGDVPVSGFASSQQWPPPGLHQLPPGDPDFDLLFLSGQHLSSFSLAFSPDLPVNLPSAVGSSTVNSRTCTCISGYYVSAGSPPLTNSSTGPCTVQFTCRSAPEGGPVSFDTEMLALDLSLPGGIRLRESPTLPSRGRLYQTPSTPGAGCRVSSFFDIFFELSTDDGATWSPAERAIHLDFATPDMAVTGPSGGALDNGSPLAFGTCLVGSTKFLSCVLSNHGQSELHVSSVSIDGADASSFSFSPPPPFVIPPYGGVVALKCAFSPGSAGEKAALLHLSSDDPAHGDSSFPLSGRALVATADDDNDGVTNAQELAHADCGFDPLVSSSSVLDALRNDGFYRSSDMQSLAIGRPVLERDPATGMFHLRVGVMKSSTLGPPWTPLLQMTPTFDPATGEMDLQFAPPGGQAHFFRVFGEAP